LLAAHNAELPIGGIKESVNGEDGIPALYRFHPEIRDTLYQGSRFEKFMV
jgi:hypothetical protein